MVVVSGDDDTEHALDVVIEQGRSRVPVVGESLDDIVGVLYARDLLALMDSGEGPRSVPEIMRPAYFVPETKRLSDLLRELQADQVHLAVVVDEFGGTAGLVTIEDLLEEIVGEIVDEYDVEEPMIVELGEGAYLVDARLPVDELGELVGTELPAEDWDTVGGLLLGLAGRIPREGESFELDRVTLTAVRVQGRRIAQVRVSA
jgi:CBS domain containing-hemolysin-like protein